MPSGAGWLLLSVAPANRYGGVAFALMLMSFSAGAVLIFINFLALRQSVTPEPLLCRMTATMRWLTLLAAAPGALMGGWLGGACRAARRAALFRWGLGVAGSRGVALVADARADIAADTGLRCRLGRRGSFGVDQPGCDLDVDVDGAGAKRSTASVMMPSMPSVSSRCTSDVSLGV